MSDLEKEKNKLILLQANKIRLLGLLAKEKEAVEKKITDMTAIFDESIQRQQEKIDSLIGN